MGRGDVPIGLTSATALLRIVQLERHKMHLPFYDGFYIWSICPIVYHIIARVWITLSVSL